MKIVRKSNAQATNSTVTDDAHGPPVHATPYPEHEANKRNPATSEFKRADFSHMTLQELHDLINCQTRSGQLSLEQSAIFTWLSSSSSSSNKTSTHSADLDEQIHFNFLDEAQSGQDTALAKGNIQEARKFAKALELMFKIQGQTIGVDTIV